MLILRQTQKLLPLPIVKRSVEIFRKLILFSATSMAGTIVDLSLQWLLSNFVYEGNYFGTYWIAPTISFEIATIVNFFIAYYLVWKERVSRPGSIRSLLRHFAGYNATCIGGYLLKLAAMQGFHFLFVFLNWFQGWSVESVISSFLGLCFSGTFNFLINEFVIFNKKKIAAKEEKDGEQTA